jgi:hypothetical protein
MMPSSIQSMLWLRVKILLQAMDHRQHRRTKLFVGQVTLLLAASVVYYQRTFFTTNQPESSISIVNTNSSVSTVSTSDKVIRPPKHWILTAQQKGKVDCQISTTPVVSSPSISLPTTEQFTIDNEKEQYVLHIHGLHHSGTGYLRQTLYDALNQEFSHKSEYINGTIASMQDSLRPYQQLIDEAGTDKKKISQLHKRYYKPEDEGQHLQTIYPSFAVRYSKVKNVKGSDKFNRLSYIADICDVVNNEDTSDNVSALDSSGDDGLPDVDNYKLLGNALFQQWSKYWDTSATFLLQKSPMLDLLFLEKTKILPTLHVIVVRHPMTSNSWG